VGGEDVRNYLGRMGLAKVAYVYCQKFLLSLLHLLMHQMGEIII
jgi:hypothetical protein